MNCDVLICLYVVLIYGVSIENAKEAKNILTSNFEMKAFSELMWL